MARKRVAPFDPPTAADFEKLGDTRVRVGPKGGFMWLCECENCSRVASGLTASGKKVCSRHGGSTANQRSPEAHAKAIAEGRDPPRRPGRPVQHGFYSVVDGYKVDQLVEEYRANRLDPDATDDDMLYLRAYLDELKVMRPDGQEVANMLHEAVPLVAAFLREKTDEHSDFSGRQLSVQEVLSQLQMLDSFNASLAQLRETLKLMLALTTGVEERHERLVMLAKVRAETRLKNAAARQLDVFMVMVERLKVINQETLPSNYAEVLNLRYAKELNEVPGRALKKSVN